jgi:hypothetical protein
VHRAQQGVLLWERGAFAEYARAMLPATRGGGFGPHWVIASVARAQLATGDEAAARKAFAALADAGLDAIPRNIRWIRAIVEVAHLCADLSDEDRAPSLIALLEPVQRLHAVLPTAVCYAGPAHHALARLHELGGRWSDALAHYEEAAAACERLGARPAEARARRDLAALLARRGQRGRADAERQRAEALAAELAM